jgi:hypothetical protein
MSRLRRVLDDGRLMQAVQPGAHGVRVEARDADHRERDVAFGDLLQPDSDGADGTDSGRDSGKPAVAEPLPGPPHRSAPTPTPAPEPTLAPANTAIPVYAPAQRPVPAPEAVAPGHAMAPAAEPVPAGAPAPVGASTPSAAGPPAPPGWQPLLPGMALNGPPRADLTLSTTKLEAPEEASEKTPAKEQSSRHPAGGSQDKAPASGGVRAWLQQRQIPQAAQQPAEPVPEKAQAGAPASTSAAALAVPAPAAPSDGPVRWADLVRTGTTRAPQAVPPMEATSGETGFSTSQDSHQGTGQEQAPPVRLEVWDGAVGPDDPITLLDRVAPSAGHTRFTVGHGARPAPQAPPSAPGAQPDAFMGASAQGTSSGMRLRVPTGDGETLRGDVRVDAQARGVRLALATENAQTARTLSSAHEMLRVQLADEGYQLDSYVIRHDGRSVVRMDSGAAGAQAHADARDREGARDPQDDNRDQGPRQPVREMSDDPVVAGWFV